MDRAGEPALFHTRTPNWTVGALVPGEDVVWIEAPSPPGEDTAVSGVAGCVADPCEMGFVPNDLRIVANNDFLAENPVVAKLFELIEIPVDDINAQNLRMHEGENTQEDIERHAEEWIAAHRDRVDVGGPYQVEVLILRVPGSRRPTCTARPAGAPAPERSRLGTCPACVHPSGRG